MVRIAVVPNFRIRHAFWEGNWPGSAGKDIGQVVFWSAPQIGATLFSEFYIFICSLIFCSQKS